MSLDLSVRNEVRGHTQWRERLLAEFPDLDEETLTDTLSGLTDLPEILAEILRSALEDEAFSDGLALRISDMKSRHERLQQRALKKRKLALGVMVEADIQVLKVADFTASLKNSAPALQIITETLIPAAYWKPQDPKLDKLGLLAALKTGADIEGVKLSDIEKQLSVRTK